MTKNERYWAERIAAEDAIYRRAESEVRTLRGAYEMAADSVEAELARLVGQDGTLSRSDAYRLGHMRTLRQKIRETCQSVAERTLSVSEAAIRKAYQAAGVGAYEDLAGAAGVRISFAVLDDTLWKKVFDTPWSGRSFSQRLWKNTEKLETTLNRVLRDGLVRGDSVARMADAIDREMACGYSNAVRLAHTETMYYLNDARLREYKASGVTEVRFYTAEDERVCGVCGPMHDKVYAIDRAPRPPLHPLCRCTYLPVVETMRFADLDEAADGRTEQETSQKPASYGVDTPGGSDIMNDRELRPIPIDDAAIARVPAVPSVWLDDEQNRALREAERDLLRSVRDKEPGTEAVAYYDANMQLLKRVVGADGQSSVSATRPPDAVISMHNHPSGETFTEDDLLSLLDADQGLRTIIAVGNNGSVYMLEAGESANPNWLLSAWQSARTTHPGYLESPDIYLQMMDDLLKSVEEGGYRYERA